MEKLNALAHQNTRVVGDLFGEEYVKASADNTITPSQFLSANEQLAHSLYGSDIADLVYRHKTDLLNRRREEVIERVSAPQSALQGLDLQRLSIVVVRPEALDMVDAVTALLDTHNLEVVVNKPTQLSFEQYWALYGPGLVDPDAHFDFPTRTLNYVDKDIRVLVTKSSRNDIATRPVSDFITSELKGRQGSYTPNTLRGDIAYTALKSLVTTDGTSFINPSHNLALDPIGAYRQLVTGGVASDRMHVTADSPLLFYAGQAMHVPDSSEMNRDIRVFLTEEEISGLAGK